MWQKELDELAKRRTIAHRLGGEKNIAKQHAHGKMTVRERIKRLCDANTFMERGMLAGVPTYDPDDPHRLDSLVPCPFIMGIGKLNGRRVAVHGDDFTIKGASVGRMYKSKGAYFVKMARSLKLPIVRLVEGAGGSIKEILEIGYTELPSSGDECAQDRVEMMSEVPVVAAGFGSVAGLGALYMVQSHFSVMVRHMCHVFVGGPPLVKSAFGEELTKEDLGGYLLHTRQTGVVDNDAVDEKDALDQVKCFLSYMPANVWGMPRRQFTEKDDPQRQEADLASIVPRDKRKAYDMRKLLTMVLDRDSMFEIGKYQGRSQITALARIDGYPVGILANDPHFLGGSFNYDVAEKFQRFIDMCDTFHLPIVNFVDQPGFTIGQESEIQGTIRKGVRASFAIIQATIPMAVIYVRKCFGVAGGAQKSGLRFCWRYAWPSAIWGNIPVEGGVYAAHRREIEAADDPKGYLEKLQDEYRAVASPFRTAEAFGIEDMIDPVETRPLLCEWVEMAYQMESTNLGPKKRGMRC
ncbi:PccB4: propionyl-CoA carboxylase, subunit beta [Desulfosarcina variabilis str. Montpellier]|uniref:acyl-CoA carboxylase subunit beta n=1 Tax=Desulfosarcina variabilis TaxID=2300 RepID=UPI003AFA43E5